MSKKKYKYIYFCIADPIKNLGNFREYLIANTEYLVTYHFYLGYTDKPSYIEIFEMGKLIKRKQYEIYKGKNNFLKNLFYYIYFNLILLTYAKRGSFVIVASPVFCIFSKFTSVLKKVTFVLWIGDYFPQHQFPMSIYHGLVNFYNQRLPVVLYESPPIQHIYEQKLRHENVSKKIRKLVTLGIARKANAAAKENKKDFILGFIGIIRDKQGLDLVLEYIDKYRDCVLEVVGNGYMLPFYKEMAKRLKIENNITFYGSVDDISRIVGNWDAGLALYVNSSDNLSKFCEPTKIKDYLSYGIPVITTNTTYFYKEIKNSGAGEIIDETEESLHNAVSRIRKSKTDYLNGVNDLVKKYTYDAWYKEKFSFLERIR